MNNMESPEIKEEIESYECCGLICRLCLSEESLQDVFKNGYFHEWISDFLSIKITTSDRLSQAICAICRIRLTEFHQYRIRCHEVQGVLQALADGTSIGDQTGGNVSLSVDTNAVNQLQPIVGKKDPVIHCELCLKEFQDGTELKNHKSIHEPEIVLCTSCGQLFETRAQLFRHLESQTTDCDVNQKDSLVNAKRTDEAGPSIEPLAPQAQAAEPEIKASSEVVQIDTDSENSAKETSIKSVAPKTGSKSSAGSEILKIDSDSDIPDLESDIGPSESETRPKSRTCNKDIADKNSESESEQDPLGFESCKDVDILDVEMEVDSIDVKDETHAEDENYSSDGSVSPSKAVRNKSKGNVNGSSDHKCHVCDKQLSSWTELLKHCDTKRHLNKVEKIRISGSESDPSSVTSNTVSEKTESDQSEQSVQASDDAGDNDNNDDDDDSDDIDKKGEERGYACSECGRTFNRQCQLKYHKAIHDENYNGELSDEESNMSSYNSNFSVTDQESSNEQEEKRKQEQKPELEQEMTQEQDPEQEQAKEKKQVQKKKQEPKLNKHIKKQKSKTSVKKSTVNTEKQKQKQTKGQILETYCAKCDKQFLTRKKYTNHLTYHRPKKRQDPKQKQEHPCEECGKVFSMKKDLCFHMKYHRAIERLRKPTVATQADADKFMGANDNNADVEQNVASAKIDPVFEGPPYQCDFCPKSLQCPKALLRHRRNQHGPKNHKCDVCDVQVILRGSMTQHVYSKLHLKNLKEKWRNENKAYENGYPVKTIKDSDLLNNDETYNKYKTSRLVKNYNKPSKCDKCDKVFPNVWSLGNHKKYHRPMKITCEICGKPCYNSAVLKKHIVTHLSKEERQSAKPPRDGKPLPRPHKCELCPSTYITYPSLWAHVQVKHKNNTHECEICGYQFMMKEFLTRHMKRHVLLGHTKEEFQALKKLAPKKSKMKNRKSNADAPGKHQSSSKSEKINKPHKNDTQKCAKPSAELPFQCDICEKSFETLVLLYRHKRYLHKPKRFKCPICDKHFASRKQRNMHMKGHDRLESDSIKDYECEECHKIYPSWKSLYSHVANGHIKRKKRSEEKTVPCQKCNKMFQTQTQKDLHFRTVHASVEYKCHICDIVFPIRVKLWEHMTKQHENKQTIDVSKPKEPVESSEQPDQKDVSNEKERSESETAVNAASRKQPRRSVKTRSGAKQ